MNDGRQTPTAAPRRWRRVTIILAVTTVVVVALAAVWLRESGETPHEETLAAAQAALAAGDFASAEDLANAHLKHEPDSGPALLIAGDAAAGQRRLGDAVDYYDRVSEQDAAAPLALWAATTILVDNGQMELAAQRLRRLLLIDRADLRATHRMAFVLNASGQRWRAARYLFRLLEKGDIGDDELVLLGNRDIAVSLPVPPEINARQDNADAYVVLAIAKRAVSEQQWGEALTLLRELIVNRPELVEAHVQLGIVLQEIAPLEKRIAWQAALPADAGQHPDIWVLRGNLAQQQDHTEAAARCYGEALRLEPNHRQANYLLGQVLTSLGRGDDAAPFLARAEKVRRLEQVLLDIYLAPHGDKNAELYQQAAELCRDVGRYWEALAWADRAAELVAAAEWIAPLRDELRDKLAKIPPRTDRQATPLANFDPAEFPLPHADTEIATAAPTTTSPQRPITFDEIATDAGIDFTYFNGGEASVETRKMYEFTGGGVAVLDYDNDGWPDLYFTQGCRWPPAEGQREFLDRLYRNRGDGTFADVTAQAGLVEDRFSQGVAAGDIDNDGDDDLYVANIGRNRLFRNNGDGTFTDLSDSVAVGGEEWTTSCAIADFNGDGIPDIYAVNYLTGPDIFEAECDFPSGYRGLCSPQRFLGQQDRLYLGLGDGQFRDVTDEAGIAVPNGKGLGIVAADLAGDGRLDLYVANDGVANFLFENVTSDNTNGPQFRETGLASGTALNYSGAAEAGMGIAVGDANGDGQLDLFVTNYYQESNTLYLARGGGFYEDATRRSGLHVPSLPFLGFGTQFLDADLDGDLDLVVANGHVDNPPGNPKPYHMRPQFFLNTGAGQFVEARPESLGSYFVTEHLGRGLARLDFDRDGREDFVVSHLDAPVALLRNTTRRPGHYLTVRLRGTKSARDAIGATVTLTAGDQTWTKQLTAGDGYQARNERQLVFGLGLRTKVDQLRVRWPSGDAQTFDQTPSGQIVEVTEGEAEFRILPPPAPNASP